MIAQEEEEDLNPLLRVSDFFLSLSRLQSFLCSLSPSPLSHNSVLSLSSAPVSPLLLLHRSSSGTANLCPAGYICPAGTGDYTVNPCIAGEVCVAGSSVASTCQPASISAPNAGYTTVTPGTYLWECVPGYFGTPQTRVCSITTGAFNGNNVLCTPCSQVAPSAPTNGDSRVLVTGTWRYTCKPGYYGTVTDRVCSTSTGSFSGTAPTCTACGGLGFYCPGGDDSRRLQCPAGTWGDPNNLLLGSAACSGPCTAGYYCPLQSTTSTAYRCGDASVFCPSGAAQPTAVRSNYYSAPLTSPVTIRSSELACPTERMCEGGLILPGISFGDSCPVDLPGTTAPEVYSGVDFGPAFSIYTNGSVLGYNVVISKIATLDSTCAIFASNFSWNNATKRVSIASPLDYPSCQSGFTLTLNATRKFDSSLFATCVVNVTITQVAKKPVITDCGPRQIAESTIAGTPVSNPTAGGSAGLVATTTKICTSIRW
jgi:hypothetical protein